MSSRARLSGALFLAFAVFGFSATPAGATKTHLRLETFGSAAQPKFSPPNGLVVDQSSGDLLVIDSGADTVSRFNPDGTPADFSALGTNVLDAKGVGDGTPQNGFAFGLFPGDQQIAVDSSGTLTDGNIYVTQGHKTAGNLVDVFASNGEYLGQLKGAGATLFGTAGFPFSPCGVAVDADGNLFVGAGYENKVYKLDPSANPPLSSDLVATYTHSEQICNLAAGAGPSAGSIFANTLSTQKGDSVLKLSSADLGLQGIASPGEERLVGVDPTDGHLYVFGGVLNENNSLIQHRVSEYDGSSLISTFATGPSGGIAIDGLSERIYVSAFDTVAVYGPLVTIPDVTTGGATITGDTSVTLNGTVDPDGVPLEECFFEYGLASAYGQKVPCAELVGEIGTISKDVHADIGGLDAETLYHFRLVAKNANDTVEGKDQTFKTPSKPGIVDQWSIDVGTSEATIKAKVNPENSPTTYRFEWGTTTSYTNSTAEIALGSDNVDRTVALTLDDLTPESSYHYRIVASNGIGTSEEPDRSFTTYPLPKQPTNPCPNQAFRTGPSAYLPECRAYEMVSPIDKNGGDVKVLVQGRGFPARLDQSADDGSRFAYSSVTAFAGALGSPWSSEYFATRGADGWSTEAINPPQVPPSLTDNPVLKLDVQYRSFSSDLSTAWLNHNYNPPLDECAPEGFINLYRRDNLTGAYEALVVSPPAAALTPASDYRIELQGLSADGNVAVFRANAKLTEDASSVKGIYQLYSHTRDSEGGCGQLRLISVKPNGTAVTQEVSAGTGKGLAEYREGAVAQSTSIDGSRVYFTANTTGIGPGSLFVRVNADQSQGPVGGGKCVFPVSGGCTLEISASAARFWTASTDGSRAIYSVGEDLFEYDVDKALASEAASTLIAGKVHGVVAATDDASRIYFVSTTQIEGKGVADKPNLYLYEPGKAAPDRYRLVATLSNRDLGGSLYFGLAIGFSEPISNGTRLTPDGSHLAFVSQANITGYDNTDADSGEPAIELYLYDTGSEEVSCISCNPSGARPEGRLFEVENELIRRVAAMMPPGESQTFAPRALSSNGNSLFFESFDALLPRDVNGKADAYAWQRASNQEECDTRGAELYVPSSGGCLSLISSGLSPIDTEIADATPDGSSVFIRTAESLLPQDSDQVDVYVARVNGGFPQPPGIPAACEGEACQGPLSPPNDPTPASSAFQGAGNVIDTGPTKPRCRKGKVRRKGRCVPRKSRKSVKRARGAAR